MERKGAAAMAMEIHARLGFEEEQSKKGARFLPTYEVVETRGQRLATPAQGVITAAMAWALPQGANDFDGWLAKGPRLSVREAEELQRVVEAAKGRKSRAPPATRWHTRYFVLRGAMLFYLHHPDAEQLAGVIPLEGCTVERVGQDAEDVPNPDENAGNNVMDANPAADNDGGHVTAPASDAAKSGRPDGYEIVLRHGERRTFRLMAGKESEYLDWADRLEAAAREPAAPLPLRTILGREPELLAQEEAGEDAADAASDDTGSDDATMDGTTTDGAATDGATTDGATTDGALSPRSVESPAEMLQQPAYAGPTEAVMGRALEKAEAETLVSTPLLVAGMETSGPVCAEPGAPPTWLQSAVKQQTLDVSMPDWQVHATTAAPSGSQEVTAERPVSWFAPLVCASGIARSVVRAKYLGTDGEYRTDAARDNVVFYTVVLTTQEDDEGDASVSRILRARFSAFAALAQELRQGAPEAALPPLPAKTMLPTTWSTCGIPFLDDRKDALETWLIEVAEAVAMSDTGTSVLLRFFAGQLSSQGVVMM